MLLGDQKSGGGFMPWPVPSSGTLLKMQGWYSHGPDSDTLDRSTIRFVFQWIQSFLDSISQINLYPLAGYYSSLPQLAFQRSPLHKHFPTHSICTIYRSNEDTFQIIDTNCPVHLYSKCVIFICSDKEKFIYLQKNFQRNVFT